MSAGVTTGVTAKFGAVLNENGAPIKLPAGAVWTWQSSDPLAVLSADPADASGATEDVTLPATDTTTSITITASTTDPTGAPVNGSITVPVTPGQVNVFTVTVTQIA